jgi:hypothetical protein
MRFRKYEESDKEVNDYIMYLNEIQKGSKSSF